MTPQEIDPDLSVQESPERHLAVAYCKLGALRATVPAQDLLKEVTIIFITSTIVWPQVNSREGTQPHPSIENWIKDLLAWPHSSEQDPDSSIVSLSHEEASTSFLYLSIKGQTE